MRVFSTVDSHELVSPSPRELEVLRLVSMGASNKEIAARLDISANTVKSHVRLLLFQTGFKNRTELGRWVTLHPELFDGHAVDISLHPVGCLCGGDHCTTPKCA